MTVECVVEDRGTAQLARLRGSLRLADIADVRTNLLKCLAEQPAAVLVDLADLTVAEPLAMAVLIAVARQASRWPGVPVLLCAPTPDTARLLGAAAYRRLPVFPSQAAAYDHVGRAGDAPPTIFEVLPPIAGAARHGRDMVTDACVRWDLPRLIGPASLVVSELIGNVVEHALTTMTLRLTRWERFLYISVRDGSPIEPPDTVSLPEPGRIGGRGLYLVNAMAHSWGCLPTRDGKVVWASFLAAEP